MKKQGFTLIELLISLALFSYVFSALMFIFIQFSRDTREIRGCRATSLIIIQKMLTEAYDLQVSTSSDEVTFKYNAHDDETLHADKNILSIFKASEPATSAKLDECVNNGIYFKRSSGIVTGPFLDNRKCLEISYSYLNSSSTIVTMCAFK